MFRNKLSTLLMGVLFCIGMMSCGNTDDEELLTNSGGKGDAVLNDKLGSLTFSLVSQNIVETQQVTLCDNFYCTKKAYECGNAELTVLNNSSLLQTTIPTISMDYCDFLERMKEKTNEIKITLIDSAEDTRSALYDGLKTKYGSPYVYSDGRASMELMRIIDNCRESNGNVLIKSDDWRYGVSLLKGSESDIRNYCNAVLAKDKSTNRYKKILSELDAIFTALPVASFFAPYTVSIDDLDELTVDALLETLSE